MGGDREERPGEARREALEAAEHERTTLDNLTVTDKPDAVADALQRGDTDAAREMTWTTDTRPTLKKIEEALDGRREGAGGSRKEN